MTKLESGAQSIFVISWYSKLKLYLLKLKSHLGLSEAQGNTMLALLMCDEYSHLEEDTKTFIVITVDKI